MKPTDFYDADPARRSSEEIRLGDGWTSAAAPNATCSLFWIKNTGELCAVAAVARGVKLPGSLGPDGIGVARMTKLTDEDVDIEVVSHVASEEQLRLLIESGEVHGFKRAS